MKILIVEDDHDYARALSEALEERGFDCLMADNGAIALDVMKELGPPDVVLLDLGLPVMSGAEMRSIMLADPVLWNIPVIVVSGYSLNGSWRHQLKAAGYLIKGSLDLNMLAALIRQFEA